MAKSRNRDGERNQHRPLSVKPAKPTSKARKRKAGAPQLPAASVSIPEANGTVANPAATEVWATRTAATTTSTPDTSGTAVQIRSKTPLVVSPAATEVLATQTSAVKPGKHRSNSRKRKAGAPQLLAASASIPEANGTVVNPGATEVSATPTTATTTSTLDSTGTAVQIRSKTPLVVSPAATEVLATQTSAVKPGKHRSNSRKRKAGAPQLPAASASIPEAKGTVANPAATEVSATRTAATTTSSPDTSGTAGLIETQIEVALHDNADAAHLKDIALGHHGNIMPRHRKLLSDIGSLMPHMPNIQRNNDKSTFLESATSSFIIYMEWVESEECVYTWIGDRQRMFKLELHAVFESNSEPFICKNSLLSFSCGFDDGEHWNDLKHVLEEIFGSSQNKSIAPDYLYAFTRLGETLHFQIYQILGIEQSSLQNEIKLTKIAPSFSMKPVEVNSGQSSLPIFDSKKLISEELLNLEHVSGFLPSNGPSDVSLIKHIIEHSHIPNVLLLPRPRDQSRLNGFNSDLREFLERCPATYLAVVPGSNPATEYRDISDPFRSLSRSLILIVGAAIKRKLCIRGLDIEKILVKKAVARLHGVELVAFTEARALRMFRQIRHILKWCMPEGIPEDVKLVLALLKDKPLETYDHIVHSAVWIPAWDRCHYLEDTYTVFKCDLHLASRIRFAEGEIRPLLTNWRAKMEQNTLLDAVVKHNQRMPRGYANKTEEDQEKDREHVKMRKINDLKKNTMDENIIASNDSLCALLTCQEFFASCRHSIVHLPETAAKLGFPPMQPEMKNFIVSSEFAAVYPLIQEGLCQVTSKTPEQLGLTKYFKTDVTSDLL